MSPTKIVLSCLCVLVLLCINTQSQEVEKFCGKKLSRALSLLCGKGFARKTKKSIDPMEYYADIDDDIPSIFEDSPFLSKIFASSLVKTRRRRHAVVDECCNKPCTLDELALYCL